MLGSFPLQIKARNISVTPSLILQSLNMFHRPRVIPLQQGFPFLILQYTAVLKGPSPPWNQNFSCRWPHASLCFPQAWKVSEHRTVEMQSAIHPSSQMARQDSLCPFPRESCIKIFRGEEQMGYLGSCFVQKPGSRHSWLIRNCCWVRARCIPC